MVFHPLETLTRGPFVIWTFLHLSSLRPTPEADVLKQPLATNEAEIDAQYLLLYLSRWWFETFFIYTPSWGWWSIAAWWFQIVFIFTPTMGWFNHQLVIASAKLAKRLKLLGATVSFSRKNVKFILLFSWSQISEYSKFYTPCTLRWRKTDHVHLCIYIKLPFGRSKSKLSKSANRWNF